MRSFFNLSKMNTQAIDFGANSCEEKKTKLNFSFVIENHIGVVFTFFLYCTEP